MVWKSISHDIFAVDFDGTICDHVYPRIGKAVPGALETLRELNKNNTIILWTMRDSDELEAAADYLAKNGVHLAAINNNVPSGDWSESRKVYANYYIDDAAVGTPLIQVKGFARPCVDWAKIREELGMEPL